jgi:hypothetical protein
MGLSEIRKRKAVDEDIRRRGNGEGDEESSDGGRWRRRGSGQSVGGRRGEVESVEFGVGRLDGSSFGEREDGRGLEEGGSLLGSRSSFALQVSGRGRSAGLDVLELVLERVSESSKDDWKKT